MSRRKQAYPQQVQEKAAQEGPKNVVKQANRLAACDQTSPQTIVFQSLFDRQSRNVSLDSNNRPRRTKESKTENFAFFSVNALQIESMSEQNFNPSQVEAKRMQQGDVNTEEKTQKIAASPREHSDSETPFDPEKEVERGKKCFHIRNNVLRTLLLYSRSRTPKFMQSFVSATDK